MIRFRAAIYAALFAVFSAGMTAAQDVTLTSRDGTVEIGGTLLGYDGEFYRVDTRYGELTIDGSGVICDGPGCPNLSAFVAEVTLSGSSMMGELLLPELIESFARFNGLTPRPEATSHRGLRLVLTDAVAGRDVIGFTIRASNTDQGFADLLSNEADIVMALREVRPAERAEAIATGMGDLTGRGRARTLALDALVPVVAPGNPMRQISTAELARIFAGETTDWTGLIGADVPISLYLPDAGSGISQTMEDRLLRPTGQEVPATVFRHETGGETVRAAVRDPFGIAMASYTEAQDAQVLNLGGGCGFTLIANRQTIKTEDYPLTAPMFLYLPARRLPKTAREFLAFLRGPAAQMVIRRAGFVDQVPEEIGIGIQGDRLANAIRAAGEETTIEELQRMIGRLSPMRRLTTTFRFESGSSRLDAQSRGNVEQLAQRLEAGEYDGRELLFVGFSDGQGAASGNLRIAKTRANAVLKAVIEAAETTPEERVRMEVDAFGEALPMACDDSAWGRQVNRRVEVWIR